MRRPAKFEAQPDGSTLRSYMPRHEKLKENECKKWRTRFQIFLKRVKALGVEGLKINRNGVPVKFKVVVKRGHRDQILHNMAVRGHSFVSGRYWDKVMFCLKKHLRFACDGNYVKSDICFQFGADLEVACPMYLDCNSCNLRQDLFMGM
jgi:hypothetical protein